MSNPPSNVQTLLALLLLVALAVSGCSSTKPKPVRWTLNITKVTPASIEVDLVGLTESEVELWENTDLDKYWSPGNRIRQNADKLSVKLDMNKPEKVDQTDAKWDSWLARGATRLLIIANLPGRFDAGKADRRRRIIPLDKKAWKSKDNTLEFKVNDTDIIVMTPSQARK